MTATALTSTNNDDDGLQVDQFGTAPARCSSSLVLSGNGDDDRYWAWS
jgi:hypothetical protein